MHVSTIYRHAIFNAVLFLTAYNSETIITIDVIMFDIVKMFDMTDQLNELATVAFEIELFVFVTSN